MPRMWETQAWEGLGESLPLRRAAELVLGCRVVTVRADVDIARRVGHVLTADRADVYPFHLRSFKNRRISSCEGFLGGFLRCSRSCRHRHRLVTRLSGWLRNRFSSGVVYQWAGQYLWCLLVCGGLYLQDTIFRWQIGISHRWGGWPAW